MKEGIIIGAGIGGLTTAIALAKRGITTTIIEQADELKDVGAGIMIAPNGLGILDRLGFANAIIAAGKEMTELRVVDIHLKPITTGKTNMTSEKPPFTTVAIHRAALQTILRNQLNSDRIVLSKKFVSYSQSNDRVSVVFDDGSALETDFLILADGIKSKGRLQLHPDLNLRYSGQTCWRFVTKFNRSRTEEGKMYEIWSNRKGLRVGFSPINESEVYVFITNCERQGGADDVLTVKNKLREMCAEFPETVLEMIAQVSADKIIRTDLFDFKPISRWTDHHVALLGDGAHATTPNLGQGACQAIEDAWVIAEQLAQEVSIEKALLQYEKIRIPKAHYITNTSFLFARMTNTTGPLKWLIKTLLRLTPDSLQEKQLDKIYSVEYMKERN